MKSAEEQGRRPIDELLEFTQALASGDYSKRILFSVDDSSFSKICNNLNNLADQLQIRKYAPKSDIELSVNSFIDVISSYANGNFDRKLLISDNGTIMDAIATGINILGEELEHTTVSRNELEIERNNLRIAKEQAEEANRLKTVFMGNLSHEVRTPLQGILGFAEMLETPNLTDDKKKQYLNILKKRANDLQNIIESLLDLASLETGEIKAFPTEISLLNITNEIFESFRYESVIRQSKIEMINNCSLSQEDVVFVDTIHFKRVLSNLLHNGNKFTEQGALILDARRSDDAYLIEVSDTGIGIPPAKIDQIFEPFRQAHEGISRSKGGIGLGLAICRKLVKLWGGEIRVTSELGKGSTFTFTIPVLK